MEDSEAFNTGVTFGQFEVILGASNLSHFFVLRNRTANHNTRTQNNAHQHIIKNFSTHIVKKYVDSIGCEFIKSSTNIFIFVINGRIKFEFVN